MGDDSVHVCDGCLDFQSLAEAGCFVTVLVVGSEVGNSAFSSYRNEEIRGIRHEEIRENSVLTYIWWAQLAVLST